MKRFSFSTVAGILPALLVLCSLAAAGTTELPIKMGDTEMEIGDRLRIRSKVMGVDPVKQTLKVAEKEVRLLDTTLGGQTLKTRLLDVEGKPADFATFKNGDVVLVLRKAEPKPASRGGAKPASRGGAKAVNATAGNAKAKRAKSASSKSAKSKPAKSKPAGAKPSRATSKRAAAKAAGTTRSGARGSRAR